jgi:hypothetical protein
LTHRVDLFARNQETRTQTSPPRFLAGAFPIPRKLEGMDRPPPDPAKLLDAWMEWERGETPPGRVMSNLKTGGLREVLEGLAAVAAPRQPVASAVDAGDPSAESWKPVV